jgi:tRNA G18 (ribose-2'-O)-methylase SpoU
MHLIPVNDLTLPELQPFHRIRDNAFGDDNSFVADSPKVVNLLLESDIEVKSILATPTYYDEYRELIVQKSIPRLYVAERNVLESIVGHTIHHNVMMHGIRPEPTPLDQLGDHIIMLDEITSTQNIGAVARSAAALGVDSYLVPSHGPHPFGRRALRVSMGYVSRLKTHIYDDIFETLKRLKADGYTIFAAEVTEDSIPLQSVDIPEKWVLLMGHEGKGISPEVLDACDVTVTIEMAPDVRSFNVAVAASIMMYQFKNG